jgi:kynureninase
MNTKKHTASITMTTNTTPPTFLAQMNSLKGARELDLSDNLHGFRAQFNLPAEKDGHKPLYFAGHSLGLMPKRAADYVQSELEEWAKYGVEGHFHAKYPWLPYHENVTGALARLVGARPNEVVAMNTLTVNLHLMLVSFYRPTKKRYKILIENNAFPSDKYAVDSQARFHGFKLKDAIIELKPRKGELTVDKEAVFEQIKKHGKSLALVMLGNCNYLSGQNFSIPEITAAAHKAGALCGFNLAHGAGNIRLQLHDDNVDFAVWCSYKYLNSGPGAIAGAYVHEKHTRDKKIQRFEGWWGHDKATRFKMGPLFKAIPTVEAWQLSNPPILQLAALRASLEIFDEATVEKLCEKSRSITAYLQFLLQNNFGDNLKIVTPNERGSMLCVKIAGRDKSVMNEFNARNIFLDFREPDIFRMTPVPLYNSYEDVFQLVQNMKAILE